MRDASLEDMAAFWIARLMENTEWINGQPAYLAMIRHAATKYFVDYQHTHLWRDYAVELQQLLSEILECLPKSTEDQPTRAKPDSWMVPRGVFIAEQNPEMFKQQFAYYWNTNHWKSDFLGALETQFWSYRDYAHGAVKGKMPFLKQLAEVWIAAATTALVRYADDNKRSWRATASILRRHADMVEADGLRALPWGIWGHLQPEKADQDDAEPDETKSGKAA